MRREKEGATHLRFVFDSLKSQLRFVESKARFKGFSGPVGSGKSVALCFQALSCATSSPGLTGLLAAPTLPLLKAATLPSLFDVMQKCDVEYEWNKSEGLVYLPAVRSSILLRSLTEADALRGTNLAWFGVDELTYAPEESWLQLEARLRNPKSKRLEGFGVWTPNGFDWVYEKFIANPVKGYDVVYATPRENKHLLDAVPDYYDRLEDSYDPLRFRQEVLGEYLALTSGRVYREFNRKVHVEPCAAREDLPLALAFDFNVDPMCVVVAQVDGERVRVLDEIVLSRASTEYACQEFFARWPKHRAGLRVYADASGQAMRTTGQSDLQILRSLITPARYGRVDFRVPKKNPAVRERIQLMNAKLCAATGEVRMSVSPTCVELIKDFEQVVYKENSVIVDKERDAKRTHLSDALGYLVWWEYEGHGQVGERSRRLI
ncbi:MAG: terminase family protein [Bryobacteraceae bacterium]